MRQTPIFVDADGARKLARIRRAAGAFTYAGNGATDGSLWDATRVGR